MRITGGEFRGRNLISPGSNLIRPTSDKARLAVFNMLTGRGLIDGAVVLDAFCGTGALGIEALSRGAGFCVFMDKSRESVNLCRKNIESLASLEGRYTLTPCDTRTPPERPSHTPKPNLLFLDPPYGKGLIEPAVMALKKGGWLEEGAVAVMETALKEPAPRLEGEIIADKEYGNSRIMLVCLQ